MRILVTNDDGWDAPGLAALKALAREMGEVFVIAPKEPHSYAGHRVTEGGPMELEQTGDNEFHLTGTPADCVRVALRSVCPDVDWVLAGINRGGNLGVDIYPSGTVAAAREAALLGKPAAAISQYKRREWEIDWERSQILARPVLQKLLAVGAEAKTYWNVNLPHLENGQVPKTICCEPDNEPLDVRFEREGAAFRYSGTYRARPFTPGRDVEQCFEGAITISRLRL